MKLDTGFPSKADGFWGSLWDLAAHFGPELLGERSNCLRRSVPVKAQDGRLIGTTELLILRMEGAAFLILENPDASEAFLFDGTIEGNFVVTHTARGAQLGEWCEDKNDDSFKLGMRSHWRQYRVEDIVPPSSRQLVSFHFAVGREWDVEVLFAQATLANKSLVGSRPKNHPFSPHAIPSTMQCVQGQSDGYPEHVDDPELQLALALSLQETEGHSVRRWGRAKEKSNDEKHVTGDVIPTSKCPVCLEPLVVKAPLPCCEVCVTCASLWAAEQESQGLAADEFLCPLCAKCLPDTLLSALLRKDALARAHERILQRNTEEGAQPLESILPRRTLARLGLKQCPRCGEGLQKESETCHKMICRTCRARFCFRCLARLEYFNCGCTGAEHNFVDPLDGRILTHQ